MRPAPFLRTAVVFLFTAVLAVPAFADAPVSRSPRAAAPATRTPEEQVWYDRLIAAMNASDVLADNAMTGGDSYELGRTGGNYIEALFMAFRATGEKQFLDRIYDLTELGRGSLRDAWLDGTTDGYTSWLWLADPTNATYYGKDTNWLDESISSGNVALWTWVLNANRGLDSRYGPAADFWRDWLENQFLAKWYARAGGDPLTAWNTPYAAFYKPDLEPRSANWRLAHYLWLVTGDTFYRDRQNEIVEELWGANHVNPSHPSAFRFSKETAPSSVNWMLVNYANYYARVVLEMNLAGMPHYSDPVNMKLFAGTFRDVVYASSMPARSSMTNDVNGGGSTSFDLYAFNGFSTWDSTGFLMNLANASVTGAGNYAGGGTSKAARNDVYLSSYALEALSPEGTTATSVARFDAEPQSDGSVRIEWSLSGADATTRTNLYRLSPDGIERTVVNTQPLEGPGPHVVVDSQPGAGAVTYALYEVTDSGEQRLQSLTVDPGATGASGLRLAPPTPNPFGASTRIAFDLPRAGHVRVRILDSSGRLVRELADGDLAAGPHERAWDGLDGSGRPAPSGIYYASVETPSGRVTRRAVRVR